MKLYAFALVVVVVASCTMGEEEMEPLEEEDLDGEESSSPLEARILVPGVNGNHCIASPFNCRFRAGGSRVETQAGGETWGVSTGASVRDGNGNVLRAQTASRMTFNYGQTRLLAGKAHALALTTSNGSAGWYPIDRILGEASFRQQNGEVNAKDPGQGAMACYAIGNSHDASIELKKVVHDSRAVHERAGDYLPLVRQNGRRSANLIFSVPGFGLGGATADHFPAGTKFQRVQVPTSGGNPSITIPLWVKDGDGRYRKRSGDMRFFYGFVRSGADGVKRFGWMAEDALAVSSGC
ncbi:MAG: hypothetical protein H0T89_35125 [Deltaproteobacteria bacterium]|nr:hypothetical protein [Deltaproteobacteria bacterium]MDQ3300629.1 hypothetical protein [Myxococcota bacterium]